MLDSKVMTSFINILILSLLLFSLSIKVKFIRMVKLFMNKELLILWKEMFVVKCEE